MYDCRRSFDYCQCWGLSSNTVKVIFNLKIIKRNGIAIGLTVDHKPDNEIEKKRILRKGGNVIGNRIENISVSRAFGDFVYKKQKHKLKKNLVSVKPDVF